MTVATDNTKDIHEGNGVTWEWEYTFPIAAKTDIVVETLDSLGVHSTLTCDVDYVVNGVGDADGGTIEYPIGGSGTKFATGGTITIYRATPQLQLNDFVNQSTLDLESLESTLDGVVRMIQELQEQLDRTSMTPIVIPEAEEATPNSLYIYTGSTAPSDPDEGQIYFNTSTHYLYMWTIVGGNAEWTKFGQVLQTPALGENQRNFGYLPLSAGSYFPLTGVLYMNGGGTDRRIAGVADPVYDDDAANRGWSNSTYVAKAGSTMTGPLAMGSQKITGLGAGTVDSTDAASMSDVHDHDHDGTDAVKVAVANINIGTVTNGYIPLAVSNALTLEKPWYIAYTASSDYVSNIAWSTVCEITLPDSLVTRTPDLWLLFTVTLAGSAAYDLRCLVGSPSVVETHTTWAQTGTPVYTYKWTPAYVNPYKVRIEMQGGGSSVTEGAASLVVLAY